MPIFEYACGACGHRFEKLQKGSEEEKPNCPSCGSHDVNKELSTFSSGAASSSGSCAPSTGGG